MNKITASICRLRLPQTLKERLFGVFPTLFAVLMIGAALPLKAIETTQQIAGYTSNPGDSRALLLTRFFQDPATNKVRLVIANDVNSEKQVTLELFTDIAPATTANFLRYVNEGYYDYTFFHRRVKDFVVQGGGYYQTGSGIAKIPAFDPVRNEFDASKMSNTRGTVAMAKLPAEAQGGGPDSATNEWFVNISDNSDNLDAQNGGFTTFAKLATEADMAVFDAINNLKTMGEEKVVDSGDFYYDTPFVGNINAEQQWGFVSLISASPVGITFSVVGNSHPQYVQAEINVEDGRWLELKSLQATEDGQSDITIEARTTDGQTARQTFTVVVNRRFVEGGNVLEMGDAAAGEYASATIENFNLYDYAPGAPFSIQNGEVSFDGKKWLKKGTIPAGATKLYIRTKAAKNAKGTVTATLTLDGDPVYLKVATGQADLALGFSIPKKDLVSYDYVDEQGKPQVGYYIKELYNGSKLDIDFAVGNLGKAPSKATTLEVWLAGATDEAWDQMIANKKAVVKVKVPALKPGQQKKIKVKNITVAPQGAYERKTTTANDGSSVPYYVQEIVFRSILGRESAAQEESDLSNNSQEFSTALYRTTLTGNHLVPQEYPLRDGQKFDVGFYLSTDFFPCPATKAELWDMNTGKLVKKFTIPKISPWQQRLFIIKGLVAKGPNDSGNTTGRYDLPYKIIVDPEKKALGTNETLLNYEFKQELALPDFEINDIYLANPAEVKQGGAPIIQLKINNNGAGYGIFNSLFLWNNVSWTAASAPAMGESLKGETTYKDAKSILRGASCATDSDNAKEAYATYIHTKPIKLKKLPAGTTSFTVGAMVNADAKKQTREQNLNNNAFVKTFNLAD
ncbi:MAG: peptidylprolyl isomerase [Puniceicoccales bacterium]|jgi:cyclophilin family peptidyl-prolyl cis-trans isomerase|nr:peptidylprolyl isomerase [Puniceicoccales bacterium]